MSTIESPSRRTELIRVHLEPELRQALAQLARREGRSLSGRLRQLVADRVVAAAEREGTG
jgi:hypothetical protein